MGRMRKRGFIKAGNWKYPKKTTNDYFPLGPFNGHNTKMVVENLSKIPLNLYLLEGKKTAGAILSPPVKRGDYSKTALFWGFLG